MKQHRRKIGVHWSWERWWLIAADEGTRDQTMTKYTVKYFNRACLFLVHTYDKIERKTTNSTCWIFSWRFLIDFQWSATKILKSHLFKSSILGKILKLNYR